MDNDLPARTKAFAIRVVTLVRALPNTVEGRAVGNQLIRSGTSVGANYRAAQRARSKKEFIARLSIAQEEADESVYWLEIIMDTKILPAKRIKPLHEEASELTAILSAAIKTARKK